MKSLLLIAVLGLTGLAYANSMNSGWTFDDMAIRMWLGPGLPEEAAREFGISHRPLLFLSYWLNAKQGGIDSTFWFHVTNLVLHVLMVALVFAIANKVLQSSLPAAVGAALFGIHPLFSSAVNYIDGRGSMLSAFLILVAGYLLVYFRTWRKWPFALLALAMACAVKEEAAVFAVLALGYGIVMQKRWLVWSSISAMAAGLAGIMIAAPYIPTIFTSKFAMPAASLVENGFDILTRSEQIRAIANGFVFHILRQLIWPSGITIDPAPILGWWKFAVSAAVLAALAGLVVWRKPSAGVRLGAAALLASPMLGASVIMLADPLFEYRSYICGLGVALLAGAAFQWVYDRAPVVAGNVAVAILIIFALATSQRNELWRSPEALWADAYQKSPNAIRTAQNYAADLMAVQKPKEAIAILKHALEQRPTARGLNGNMALAHLQIADFATAENYAKKGLPMVSSYTVLALAQLSQGKKDEALDAANHAVDIGKNSPDAWSAMAQVMAARGQSYDSYLAMARAKGISELTRTP